MVSTTATLARGHTQATCSTQVQFLPRPHATPQTTSFEDEIMFYKVYYATRFSARQDNMFQFHTVVEANNRMAGLRVAFDTVPDAFRWGMIEETEINCPVCNDTGWVEPHDCGCAFEAHCHCGEGYNCIDCDINTADIVALCDQCGEYKDNVWYDDHICEDCRHEKYTHQPEPVTVQVSFWKTGARAGMFSQQAYTVLSRDAEKNTVTIELMPGMPKTVSVEQVRAA